MSSFSSFMKGLIFFIVCEILGFTLTVTNGKIIDRLFNIFMKTGIDGGAGTEWDTNWIVNGLINIEYLIGPVIMLIGIGVLYVYCIKDSRYDDEEERIQYQRL